MDVYLTNTLLNLSLLYQSLFKTWSIQSLNQLTGEFYGYTAPMYIHISFGLRVLTPYKRTFNSCIFLHHIVYVRIIWTIGNSERPINMIDSTC